MTYGIERDITEPQLDLVRVLQRKLGIPDGALDGYCEKRFNGPVAALDIRQASALIESMKAWKDIPPEIRKAMGQLGLFESEATA